LAFTHHSTSTSAKKNVDWKTKGFSDENSQWISMSLFHSRPTSDTFISISIYSLKFFIFLTLGLFGCSFTVWRFHSKCVFAAKNKRTNKLFIHHGRISSSSSIFVLHVRKKKFVDLLVLEILYTCYMKITLTCKLTAKLEAAFRKLKEKTLS
jgi:hypothetical protein